MNGFDLVLFVVKTFFLSHIVLFGLVIGLTGLVLSIVFLGTGPAVLAFLRSSVGRILIAMVVAGVLGWEARGYVDDSVALARQLAAERKASSAALAAAKANTDRAIALAADARRQAEAAQATARDASAREAQAHDAARNLQEEVDDYADKLDARVACGLSDADVRGLRRIGVPARKRP